MKKIFEALKLQHDSEKNVLIIVSDQTDDRLNKEETYKNRNLFKEKGFKWNGTNWQIPSDQFEEAKKVITIANKTNYFIDKLEDVEAAVSSTNEPASALISGKITQFIEQLANETDEAAASEQIQRYLNFFANFKQYRYSFNNRILIYIQKPDAKHVDSFKGWKEKNRVVKKGAKGLKILVPIFKKENNPIVNKDAENPRPLGFRIGNVFYLISYHGRWQPSRMSIPSNKRASAVELRRSLPSLTSDALGQENVPRSSRFAKIQIPVPSQ